MNSTIKIAFTAIVTASIAAISGCTSLHKSENAYDEYQKGDFVLYRGTEEFAIDPFATKLQLQSCLNLNQAHSSSKTVQATVASESPLLASSVINSVKYYNEHAAIHRIRAEYHKFSSAMFPEFDFPVKFFAVKELQLDNWFKDLSGDANKQSADRLVIGSGTTNEFYVYELSTAFPIHNADSNKYSLSEQPSIQVRFQVTTYQNNNSITFNENRIGGFSVESNSIETSKLASDLIGLVAADLFANSGSCLEGSLRGGSFHTTTRAMVKRRKSSYPLEEKGAGGLLCVKDEYQNVTEPFTVEVALYNASIAEKLSPNGCTIENAFKVVRLIKKPSNNLCFKTFEKDDLDMITAKRSAFYKAYAKPASHWLVNTFDVHDVPMGCSTYTANELHFNAQLED